VGWTSGQHEKQLQSIHGQRQLKGFLSRPFAKKAGELLYLIKNQLRIMTDLLTGHCRLEGLLFRLGLVDRCEGSVTVRHWHYLGLGTGVIIA
jgi:hypothetical protein